MIICMCEEAHRAPHLQVSQFTFADGKKKKTSNEMKSELSPGDHGDQAAATESILCLGNVYVFLNHARMMNLS